MFPAEYPVALRDRLGDPGAVALADVLALHKDDIVTVVLDRFEERLGQEFGRIRAEMAQARGELCGEMAHLRGELRGEMDVLRIEIRSDMKELRTELRSDFKVEVANVRSDLLKWSFVFWVGQVAAVVGLVALIR